MESSMDELIEPAGEEKVPGEGQRPPGGKVLLRLQQHLEERGFIEVAQAFVERAVADERRSDFDVRALAFSAAPPGQASYLSGTTCMPSRRRSLSTTSR
jgi:hypothetical protein